jgi:hypothetical protein
LHTTAASQLWLWHQLQRIDQVLPPERPLTLLADRIHAGDAILSCLDELGWGYIIRLPEDTCIESKRDGWQEVRQLRKRQGRLRVFSNVRVWKGIAFSSSAIRMNIGADGLMPSLY